MQKRFNRILGFPEIKYIYRYVPDEPESNPDPTPDTPQGNESIDTVVRPLDGVPVPSYAQYSQDAERRKQAEQRLKVQDQLNHIITLREAVQEDPGSDDLSHDDHIHVYEEMGKQSGEDGGNHWTTLLLQVCIVF